MSIEQKNLGRWSLLSDNDDETPQQIPSTVSIDEKENVVLRELSANRNYRSETLALMKIDDIVVSKSTSLTDFNFRVEQTGTYSIVTIEILNSFMDNGLEELNSFNNLLKKIADVKKKLSIKIDRHGEIIEILNQKELKENWLATKEELRSDRQFNTFKPEDQDLILKGGDKEYLESFDLVGFLNKGYTIYAMLFIGYWQDYEPKKTYQLNRKVKNSTMFKDQEVPLDFEVKLKRQSENTGRVELELQGIEPDDFDTTTFKKMYKEAYPFAKIDFEEYRYDYEANYEIENKSGLIKKLNATIFEEAGSIEMFMDCNIKEFNHGEGDITQ